MGREKRILLGLLGMLAGVFVGLLSKKLLVPRPPVGAGPDVDVRTAYVEPTALVEPPRLSLRAADFAAAPPLVAAAASQPRAMQPESAGLAARDPFAALPRSVGPLTQAVAVEPPRDPEQPASMFSRRAADDDLGDEGLPAARDDTTGADTATAGGFANRVDAPVQFTPVPLEPVPFEPAGDMRPLGPTVTPVAPAATLPLPAGGVTPTSFGTAAGMPLEPAGGRPREPAGGRPREPAGGRPREPAGGRPREPAGGRHVAQAGDSWWSIAESAYGDGRLYRAVFAWNRAVDPRVTLAAGTRLELPPLDKLRAAWPALIPPAP